MAFLARSLPLPVPAPSSFVPMSPPCSKMTALSKLVELSYEGRTPTLIDIVPSMQDTLRDLVIVRAAGLAGEEGGEARDCLWISEVGCNGGGRRIRSRTLSLLPF